MVVEPPQEPEPPALPMPQPPDVIWHQAPKKPLPYLKNIRIAMLKPRQFGLEQWTRTFIIPHHWMQKIYKSEAYRDTDIPEKKPEVLTKQQKKVLYDWLINDSPFRPKPLKTHKSGRGRRPCFTTDLTEILDAAKDSDLDSDDLVYMNSDGDDSDDFQGNKIPILIGHKYQPEHMVIKKAIQNMSRPTKEQEQRIKLIMDSPELLQELRQQVSKHLGLSPDGYSV